MSTLEPRPGDTIVLDATYAFTPHPTLPKMAFGQEGRKELVYQLSKNGGRFAFKIFKPQYRVASLVDTCRNLSKLSIGGFEACRRLCFARPLYSKLIDQYPDLEYAVLMPWIQGSTWFDVVMSRASLSKDACKTIAKNTAEVLANLEKQGYAHCDVAGSNVIVNTVQGQVNFIDVEDMFGPGLPKPSACPMGTEGYQHPSSRANQDRGQWCLSGDRFSAAVLLAEMLGWFDPEIRKIGDQEHFFAPGEMQDPNGQRYKRLLSTLRGLSKKVADCFERAWTSATLEDCPPLAEWAKLLEFPVVSEWIPIPAPPPAAAPVISWEKLRRPVPDAPKFFRRTSKDVLEWLSSQGAEGYIVQESEDDSFSRFREIHKGESTRCRISSQKSPRYYRVCAYSLSGSSPWSSILSVR
jgi:serine/threonine protein kinase